MHISCSQSTLLRSIIRAYADIQVVADSRMATKSDDIYSVVLISHVQYNNIITEFLGTCRRYA